MKTTDFGPFIRDIKEKVEKTILQFCMEKSIDLNQNKSIHQTLMSLLDRVSEEQYQKLYYSTGKTKEVPMEYNIDELYTPQERARKNLIVRYLNNKGRRYTPHCILIYSHNHIVLVYNQKWRYEQYFD